MTADLGGERDRDLDRAFQVERSRFSRSPLPLSNLSEMNERRSFLRSVPAFRSLLALESSWPLFAVRALDIAHRQ
jgi:hypothetical protein